MAFDFSIVCASTSFFSDFLSFIKKLSGDNGFVVVFDVVSVLLPKVDDSLFADGINGVGFTHDHIADVFFISDNARHRTVMPIVLSLLGFDSLSF